MKKIISINRSSEIIQNNIHKSSNGLAPIMCYEPWFPRVLDSIRQSIIDGHPVMVRLHSAASYPLPSKDRYKLDLESHAVLIVGYDDDLKAVAIIDPWDNNWGGVCGGRRWLPFSVLQILCVNSTCDQVTLLTPLIFSVTSTQDSSKNLSLDLEIGFYIPRGTVMDLDSWIISNVFVECNMSHNSEMVSLNYSVPGHCKVGDKIKISLPIHNNSQDVEQVKLSIQTTIEGNRPYAFTNTIETSQTIDVSLINSSEKQYQFVAI